MEELTALLAELRQWIEAFGLTKWQVVVLLVAAMVVWRLPTLLQHRREIRALELDFRHKSDKLEARLSAELSKRERKRQRLEKKGDG